MQFKQLLTATALASIASAANVTVTTDVVVTDFTTYCPEPTSFVVNNKTITVTEATTITITGECTIPTTYTSAAPSTVAPEVETANAGNKVAVGAVAGLAAVAALF
ncbi:cell wall protein Pga48p [[Candida] jaroonii]|uniref:Cell wall protein Pga48p n=1 Tax=[Candida] jaroonii TaxID=467808 RepID=A0ACA9YC54_9ASCO|nr:cell wall protein Pga48p [[Candida] jaroonii]